MKTPKAKAGSRVRYLILACLFSTVCLAFIITMAVIQIRGGTGRFSKEDVIVRTVTVSGLRGEIYDRNGKLLVGNSTSYDLVFEYGAMSDTRREVNKALLSIRDALIATQNENCFCENLCPLEGTYPNMQFSRALSDKSSDIYKGYQRVLARNNMKESETTAEKLVTYFVKRYRLSDELYSHSDITWLLCILYEMERVDFGQYQSYTIATNVSESVITYVEEAQIEGATFSVSSERVYTYPGIASHILGRVGKITAENADYYTELGYPMDASVGTSGCEKAFEEWLRGKDGTMVIKYDKSGGIIEKYYESEPVGGNNVWLTIDIDLQIAAEQGLAENVTGISTANAGAISVMDPNTGAILALASYPTYDLSQFGSVEYYNTLLNNPNTPLYNRALQGIYAPGSTYKLGAAIAALEEGEITADTAYTCNSVYPFWHNPTCLSAHGNLKVGDAIRESCNIFFYYVGDSMGIDRISGYTSKLGLGLPTGIELPEQIGIIAGPAYRENNHLAVWNGGDNLSAAIGQSDHGYTPLQLCTYTASITNGGTHYAAHLLHSVHRFYTDEILYQSETTVMNTVPISELTLGLVKNSMEQVISSSYSLRRAFSGVNVTVGGKTGTAQVSGKTDYGVFTAAAPLYAPEIVAACVIEQGGSGSNAAIAVGKVFEAYFSRGAEE